MAQSVLEIEHIHSKKYNILVCYRNDSITEMQKLIQGCAQTYEASRIAALAQMVACLPLVQRVRGSIPCGVVNFHLKIFNFGARRGGDVHFLIARSQARIKFQTLPQYVC